MSSGALAMIAITFLALGSLLFVIFSMVRSIRNERTKGRSVWREFSLGLALMTLFLVTWLAHGFAEWQTYTDDQRSLGEPTKTGDYVAALAQSTLENWQSEFLQLFAFVSLAALYIHKGSAESKDGEERIEASLRRLEERLGTLPANASDQRGEQWKLPDTPLEVADEVPRN